MILRGLSQSPEHPGRLHLRSFDHGSEPGVVTCFGESSYVIWVYMLWWLPMIHTMAHMSCSQYEGGTATSKMDVESGIALIPWPWQMFFYRIHVFVASQIYIWSVSHISWVVYFGSVSVMRSSYGDVMSVHKLLALSIHHGSCEGFLNCRMTPIHHGQVLFTRATYNHRGISSHVPGSHRFSPTCFFDPFFRYPPFFLRPFTTLDFNVLEKNDSQLKPTQTSRDS